MKISKDSISEFTYKGQKFLLNENSKQIYDLNNNIVGQMIKQGDSNVIKWNK